MKIGSRLYGIEPQALIFMAQRLEALGFESIWRGEHIAIPKSLAKDYPYTKDGKPPFSVDTAMLDVFTVMTFLAAKTSRIKFSTGICILPLRNIWVLERCLTSLDVLSGGRLMLGVGAGWLREEFELVGADFARRGAMTSEMIQALRTMWTQREPVFKGRDIRIGETIIEPKPVSKPHPPILVGGESEAALRRAATLGDGWYGHVVTDPDSIRPTIDRLARWRSEAGRAGEPFEVTVRVRADISTDAVKRLEALGVARVVLEAGRFDDVDARCVLPDVEAFARRFKGMLAAGR
ncbi:MAG: TIGR03619 family F420-dependent LLM class oxidoreductase [Alphaproteobacteria bacterium]